MSRGVNSYYKMDTASVRVRHQTWLSPDLLLCRSGVTWHVLIAHVMHLLDVFSEYILNLNVTEYVL